MVGEGPEYEPFREAARVLVDEWCPGGYAGNHWGAFRGGVMPTKDGQHQFVINDDETYVPARKTLDLTAIRGGAISLLIYCEAVESMNAPSDERKTDG